MIAKSDLNNYDTTSTAGHNIIFNKMINVYNLLKNFCNSVNQNYKRGQGIVFSNIGDYFKKDKACYIKTRHALFISKPAFIKKNYIYKNNKSTQAPMRFKNWKRGR
ncbi:MAG: hypothetical protein ACM34J_11850 [Ignavibacteria bacterium]